MYAIKQDVVPLDFDKEHCVVVKFLTTTETLTVKFFN